MWLYRCIFTLFPYIVNCMQDNAQSQLRNEDPELMFTDVIKNISRVNNVLQELINNYQQLKKLYKSQEDSESDESSSKLHEVFKAKEGEKIKSKTTQKPLNMGEFPATQMFFSDDDESSDSVSVANEKSNSTIEDAAVKDTVNNSKDNSSSSQSTEESSDVSSEQENNNSKSDKTKPALRKKSEIVFIDKNKSTKKTVEVKPVKMDSIFLTSDKVDPKTIKVKDEITNNTKNVQKRVFAESFSKHNIWNDIFNNKPIKLQRSHVDHALKSQPANGMKQANLRSSVSIQNDVQASINDEKKINDNPMENVDNTDDEVVIKKEQFKTDVLRTAYGDACLKLVVTKCNRACTAAGKSVCHKYSCKSQFKDKYKSAARKGCRKEFHGKQPDDASSKQPDDATSNKESDVHYRGEPASQKPVIQQLTTQTAEISDFLDLTRGGYLAAACLPPSTDNVGPEKPVTLGNITQDILKQNPDMIFKVLRDKYEDACKRISAGKCRKACSSAYGAACEGSCKKEMKRAFKKACQKECKLAYKLRHDDDDDYYSEANEDSSKS